MVYRPLFSLQAWAGQQLFGLYYAGYQAMQLALLGGAALAAYAVLRRLTGSTLVALLLALTFATHPYISDMVNWPMDTATWTVGLAAATAWLLLHLNGSAGWLAALGVALALAPFTRENGLAIVAAAVAAAAYARYAGRLTTRQAVAVAVIGALVVVGYFAVRSLAGGTALRPSQLIEESGIGLTFYVREQVMAFTRWQRLGAFAYNVGAHALAAHVPIFMPCGVVWPRLVGLLAAVVLGVGAVLGLAARPRRGPWMSAALLAGAAAAALTVVGLLWPLPPEIALLAVGLALHAVLIVFIGLVVVQRRLWATGAAVVLVYAVVLILANSAIAFPYFRFRSLYLGLIGWVVLLAVAFGRRPATGWGRALRRVAVGVLTALVVVNGARVNLALPVASLVPENFDATGLMCRPEVPDDLAERAAAEAGIDLAALRACRADFAPGTAAPAVQGEALLFERHCGRSY